MSQGVSKLARGQMPSATEMFLTPANAHRVAEQLAQMRGAAMKLGQLLSMEAGDLLPRELSEILGGLRDRGHFMPFAQLEQVLEQAWGSGWRDAFRSFDEQPLAAASIGQVHAAVDHSGRRLAIKVQYPGIRASIDSDLANVVVLLKMFRLLPPGLDIEPLVAIARQQLLDETDYRLEASHLKRYRQRIQNIPGFHLPEVVEQLSSREVLAMTFIDGQSIEKLAREPAELRNRMAEAMIELTLREVLHWGMVQSDPNFANFLFDREQLSIGLLDFGALRLYDTERSQVFTRLLSAVAQEDLTRVVAAAIEVGYVDTTDSFNMRLAIADLLLTASEPIRVDGSYDFANSQLVQRLADKLMYLRNREQFQRVPPADVLFLHRKLGGIFLLCARLNARVDVAACIDRVLSNAQAAEEQRPVIA
jgi:predicted unusual protein kinase regulating ubiquinone biosynthesis (AarF/ABC1/UbiB family)